MGSFPLDPTNLAEPSPVTSNETKERFRKNPEELVELCFIIWSIRLIPKGPFLLQFMYSVSDEYSDTIDNMIGFPVIAFSTFVYIIHFMLNAFFFFQVFRSSNNFATLCSIYKVLLSYSTGLHVIPIYLFELDFNLFTIEFFLMEILLILAGSISPEVANFMAVFLFIMWCNFIREMFTPLALKMWIPKTKRNSKQHRKTEVTIKEEARESDLEDNTYVSSPAPEFHTGEEAMTSEEEKPCQTHETEVEASPVISNETHEQDTAAREHQEYLEPNVTIDKTETTKKSRNNKPRPSCARASCSNESRHRCSRCKAVSYCCYECSSKDFPHHKIFCNYVFEANKPHDTTIAEKKTTDNNEQTIEEVD